MLRTSAVYFKGTAAQMEKTRAAMELPDAEEIGRMTQLSSLFDTQADRRPPP